MFTRTFCGGLMDQAGGAPHLHLFWDAVLQGGSQEGPLF